MDNLPKEERGSRGVTVGTLQGYITYREAYGCNMCPGKVCITSKLGTSLIGQPEQLESDGKYFQEK